MQSHADVSQFGICLFSLFVTFVMELIAFRLGTAWLAKRGIHDMPGHTDANYNAISHDAPSDMQAPHGTIVGHTPDSLANDKKVDSDVESGFGDSSEDTPAAAQILGVAILEFGVVFHSVCETSGLRWTLY